MMDVKQDLRLAVIGVGLIGGSLARVLRQQGRVSHVIGVGRGVHNLERAKALGVIDCWTHDVAEAVEEADIVCIAVPMGGYADVFKAMALVLNQQVVFDVGSTKGYAIDMANDYLPDSRYFVPAHPLAGTEHSGVEASFAELFDDRVCILTPQQNTCVEAVRLVESLWQAAGSRLIQMDALQHDAFLAGVSHLPHLAAYALVYEIATERKPDDAHDPFAFAAGGFRDFTRIASSSPEMWRDIALCNRHALLKKIDGFQHVLDEIKTALEQNDGERLLQLFSTAKAARDDWMNTHGGSL